jgi:uroporphyrinogen-III decarboxylase
MQAPENPPVLAAPAPERKKVPEPVKPLQKQKPKQPAVTSKTLPQKAQSQPVNETMHAHVHEQETFSSFQQQSEVMSRFVFQPRTSAQLQQAFVWSEILQPPVSLREEK